MFNFCAHVQWLVFRRDGVVTAAQYAALAAKASAAGQAVCSFDQPGPLDELRIIPFVRWSEEI